MSGYWHANSHRYLLVFGNQTWPSRLAKFSALGFEIISEVPRRILRSLNVNNSHHFSFDLLTFQSALIFWSKPNPVTWYNKRKVLYEWEMYFCFIAARDVYHFGLPPSDGISYTIISTARTTTRKKRFKLKENTLCYSLLSSVVTKI